MAKIELSTPKLREPIRIQRHRTKGFKLADAATNGLPVVCVTRETRWGNSYRVGELVTRFETGETLPITREEAVAWFKSAAIEFKHREPREYESWIAPLRGKNLECWCLITDESGNRVPCHADVLLELANEPEGVGD